jgi:hypothetical protein
MQRPAFAKQKMRYNLEWLIDNFEKGKRAEYLFFWGQKPAPWTEFGVDFRAAMQYKSECNSSHKT